MTQRADFEPTRSLQIELSLPLVHLHAHDPETGMVCTRAKVLVRLHDVPLGLVDLTLPPDGLSPETYAPQVWRALSGSILKHLHGDGLPAITALPVSGITGPAEPGCARERRLMLAQAPSISVVVPTHQRPQELARCLRALAALNYPNYEVLVVDNAPRTRETAEVVEQARPLFARARYLREDRQGVSWARNFGAQHAEGHIVAFTDDDTSVDALWLAGIARGFAAAEHVGCVSGLTLPAQLLSPAQGWFEQFSSFSFGFEQVVHSLRSPIPHPMGLYPYSAIKYGVTVNVSYRADVFRALGGFSPDLGGGTPSMAGEDVDLYLRVLFKGYTAVYEPSALLHHFHRRRYAALRKQAFGYGSGTTAFATKMLLDEPERWRDLLRKAPRLLYSMLHAGSAKNSGKSPQFPRELTRLELRGMLYGPFGFLKSRRQVQRLRQAGRPAIPAPDRTSAGPSTFGVTVEEAHPAPFALAGRKE